MAELPPDLERLGDALTEATTRAVAARRRPFQLGCRLVACLTAGMLVFAATTPSHLGPAGPPTGGPFGLASLDEAYGMVPGGPCDPVHGAGGVHVQSRTGCLVDSPPAQVR